MAGSIGAEKAMESDIRYYMRRANAELRAARLAITPEAQARRLSLAESFNRRIAELGG